MQTKQLISDYLSGLGLEEGRGIAAAYFTYVWFVDCYNGTHKLYDDDNDGKYNICVYQHEKSQ